MSMKLKVLLALVSAALPMAANALGLGEIKLNSALNDKFNADIAVVGATSDELDSLEVKLAGLTQFSQAGLDRPEVLGQLQFLVVRNPDGTAYIHITSNAAVREPFLDFLLDANWNNGELIREYTVLLNPPAFQTANAAPTAPAPQPAAQPSAPVAAVPVPTPATAAPAMTAPETQAPAEQAPAEVAATPQAQPEAATPEPTASPPPAPAPSFEQAPAQRALGMNYGPIHRGETLSSIAKSVRPEGVTLNQMMIAIYQANPEVFMRNINRMKSGYILRMPAASDVQAINVADANAEVREQMQAWRENRIAAAPSSAASATTSPELQIVAPGSAAESSAEVPGAEQQGSGTAPSSTVKTPGTAGTPSGGLTPPAPTPANQAPLSVNSNSMANVQQQATQQNAAPSLPTPPAATNVPLPQAGQSTPAKPKPVPQQAQGSGGILDMVFSLYGIIALIVIAMIVLAVVIIKKRKAAGGSGATAKAPGRIKADWMKQESVDSGDDTAASSTTRTRSRKKIAASGDVQEKTVLAEPPTEFGDSDKTMLMASPPPMPSGGDTMMGGAATGGSQLDVSDPMAEADFHMAYGLYDQAADVLRKALRQDPNARAVQVKLLEVFFTAGDRDNFVNEAKKLRQSMGGAPDKDWESVAIMGRQVAPDEPLFSSGGGAVTGAVDLALDGGGTDTVVSDLDALGGAFTSAGAAPIPEAPAPAPAPAADNSMDFSLPDIEPMAAEPAAEFVAEAPKTAEGGMEFDLGDLNFEPTPAKQGGVEKAAPSLGTDEPTVATDFGTDSQVEFDKALNDLASFVNTNVPAQPATEEEDDKTLAIRPPKAAAPAEDLSMDLGSVPAVEDAPAGGGSSMNEIGTKLDLARAYIDMGDPDGAKSILEEVIAEGNAQQKSEAQELIKHVS
ncbi:MAG TPA: FimV/HubP family polar landmark protein [Gammaproteobacteria bacterium]|nr:FimV/HubP family polar landmark protein [Gammaproteobacteria bacterium]